MVLEWQYDQKPDGKIPQIITGYLKQAQNGLALTIQKERNGIISVFLNARQIQMFPNVRPPPAGTLITIFMIIINNVDFMH